MFLTYISLSNFFFFINSELITNPVTPLSNNASTTIHFSPFSCFNPILTITSLNNISFFSILLSAPVFYTSTDFSFFNLSFLIIVFLFSFHYLLLHSSLCFSILQIYSRTFVLAPHLLWQPLVINTNNNIRSKSLNRISL